MNLSAIDDHGQVVDWWFIYKVAGMSKTSQGAKVPGTEYVYFDASMAASGKLALSPHHVDEDGALPNTLKQLYGEEGASTQHLGWYFYNDEDPITGKTNGSRGHTKGVLAFDLGSNTAFWLIESTPKFPPKGSYSYPKTGEPNAQTFLCITLKDATVAQTIAKQMFACQQPNVYLASSIPSELEHTPNDPRLKLMQDQVASGSTPISAVVPFRSNGGTKFIAIAKNKTWGLDFYNDLVGPTLHENLDVETWEHDPTPPALDSDKIHTVVDMAGINLMPLGIDISWPEPDDHAKLCISARSESTHFVCVGDMNFTIAQRQRGGGTVAFQCEPLWQSLSICLVGVTTHLKKNSKAAKIQAAIKAKKKAAKAAT
jgi:deoxyribonuclease II